MALNPQLIRALNRAMERKPELTRISAREYKVQGSKGNTYTVKTHGHEVVCNCPARVTCVHIAAVMMDVEARKLENRAVDPEHAPLVNPVPRGRAGLGLTEVAA